MDGEDNGFAAGLSLCVTRDGQGAPAADFLPAVTNTYNLGTSSFSWKGITCDAMTVNLQSGNTVSISTFGASGFANAIAIVDGSAGNRNWQLRSGAAGVGIFDIADQTRGASCLQIGTTGAVTINSAVGATTLLVMGAPNQFSTQISGSSTTSESLGLFVVAGTNNSDAAFVVVNQANTIQFLRINGDGSCALGSAAANLGIGTLNASGGFFVNANPVAVNNPGTTFTLTGTGFSGTAPTFSVQYRLVGNLVILNVQSASNNPGTSNATTFTLTGLPAAVQPSAIQVIDRLLENNGAFINGSMIITGGTITCCATPGGVGASSWTASGAKTFSPSSIIYSLN